MHICYQGCFLHERRRCTSRCDLICSDPIPQRFPRPLPCYLQPCGGSGLQGETPTPSRLFVARLHLHGRPVLTGTLARECVDDRLWSAIFRASGPNEPRTHRYEACMTSVPGSNAACYQLDFLSPSARTVPKSTCPTLTCGTVLGCARNAIFCWPVDPLRQIPS